MNVQQMAELLANHYEHRNVNIVQVDNGYTLKGDRRFLDNTTGVATAQLERFAVATTWQSALNSTANFYATGEFRGDYTEGQSAQPVPPQPAPPAPQPILVQDAAQPAQPLI